MRRRFLAQAAGLGLLAAGSASRLFAQANRPFRIYAITWRGRTMVEQGFADHLGERGINFEFTWRDAGQNPSRLEEFAREIRAVQPDLVYTWGTPPTLGIAGPHDGVDAARHVTGIPILFAVVASPVGAKVVPALSGHGRDITGVYHVTTLAAQLAAMRAYRKFAKLGVLYNGAEGNSVATAEALRRLAVAERFELLEHRFDAGPDGKPLAQGIEEKVASLRRAGADWLYLGPDSFLFSQLERIAAAAMAQRLPTFSATEAALGTAAPVLTGLVSSYYTIGQFAAHKAEQILVGRVRARDIPIETLTRYSFIVRMDVAKQLGFLPPVSLFNHAIIR
jgi:putative ABC transport system substrate-binding protein